MTYSPGHGGNMRPPDGRTPERNSMMATLETSQPLPAARYGAGAIVFHWTMFALVFIVGVLGLLHDSWPKQTQAFWINVHAVIGIFLWLLLLVRFSYRLRYSPP